MDLLEALAELQNIVPCILPIDQALLEEGSNLPHLGFLHAHPGHFLHADPDAGRVGDVFQGLERQQVHVQDDVVVLQHPGHFIPPSEARHVHRQLMTLGEAERLGLHLETELEQCVAQRLGVPDRLICIGLPELEHLVGGDRQRHERVQVVVGRRTGKGPLVDLLPLVVLHIADRDAPLRSGERLVGAGRHHVGPLPQGILEALARDQAQNVGCVIDDQDAELLRHLRQLGNRLGKEEEALAKDQHLGVHRADQLDGLAHIDVVTVLRQGEVDDVSRVFPDRPDPVVTDVAPACR